MSQSHLPLPLVSAHARLALAMAANSAAEQAVQAAVVSTVKAMAALGPGPVRP